MPYRYTTENADDGLNLVFSLNATEADALGAEDADNLGQWFDAMLGALVMLRTGSVPRRSKFPVPAVDDWGVAITNAFVDLLPHAQGLGDAAVRMARSLGMSYADIALAMEVSRSTAQSRTQKVTSQPPTPFETWALKGDPDTALKRFRPMSEGPDHPADFALD